MNDNGRFHCTLCDYETRHFNRLALHYRYGHALDPGFKLKCNINGCPKTYSNVKSWLYHIRCKHPEFHSVTNTAEVFLDIKPPEDVQGQSNIPEPQEQNPRPVLDLEKTVGNMLLAFREEQKIPPILCAYIAGKIQELVNISQPEFVDKV